MSDFPFNETVIEENMKFIEVIREFSGKLSSEELNWHRDREHRMVKILKGKGIEGLTKKQSMQLMMKEIDKFFLF